MSRCRRAGWKKNAYPGDFCWLLRLGDCDGTNNKGKRDQS
jgi:hypothetical protein